MALLPSWGSLAPLLGARGYSSHLPAAVLGWSRPSLPESTHLAGPHSSKRLEKASPSSFLAYRAGKRATPTDMSQQAWCSRKHLLSARVHTGGVLQDLVPSHPTLWPSAWALHRLGWCWSVPTQALLGARGLTLMGRGTTLGRATAGLWALGADAPTPEAQLLTTPSSC